MSTDGETRTFHGPDADTGSGRLEVRCPSCHVPVDVAVDTQLTDITCSACGSHFSLVDQSEATRIAPSLSKMGRFDLIERIGVGGFGSVWKARDKELDRTVAIKIPRQGVMTAEEQEKFFREARAAAQLRHPNIVSVHEVGRDGDSVFIVSDFVRGVTLGDWLTGQRLTSREAAELSAKIADALHHAHEQGVIHRDLKPANVIIDGDVQPHLMDFGLARRMAGEVTLTLDGQVIGTPAYMSPEQALGEAHTADRRSDVYSMGVILFQLLTGELPFRGNARMLVHQVANDEPPSPLQFNAKIPKDLETITLKCLEKEPERRYQTARDFADELRRFLAGEPIHARPVSRFKYAWRWVRRHPVQVSMGVAALSLIIATVVAIAYFNVRAARNEAVAQKDIAVEAKEQEATERQKAVAASVAEAEARKIAVEQEKIARDEEKKAKEQEAKARREERKAILAQAAAEKAKEAEAYEAYVASIGLAAAKINDNAYDYALQLLAEAERPRRNWEWGRLLHLCQLSAAVFNADERIDALAYSPDGQTFVTGDWGGKVTVRDAKTGDVRWQVPHGTYVHSVDYSPDGQRIASGSSDTAIRIYDSADGRLLHTLSGHTDGVLTVRFSPDGRQLLSGSYDNTARLWDLETGEAVQEFKEHDWWVWSADFSPDGNRIVTAGQDGKAIVWQRRYFGKHVPFKPLTEFTGHEGAIYSARFSPNGDLVATGSYDKQVMLWDPDKVEPVDIELRLAGKDEPETNYLRLSAHAGPVRSVTFSPNGKLVLSGSEDNTIRLWDVESGEAAKTLRGHGSGVRSCVFSPDGQWVLSGGQDEKVRLWNLQGYQETRVLHAAALAGHEDAVLSARFSRDGRHIVTASRDRTARLWDAASGKPLREFQEGHEFLASTAVFFPDGRRLATGAGDNSVRIWDLAAGTELATLAPTGRMGVVAVSPDSKWLATGSPGTDLQVWDADTGKLAATLSGHAAQVCALAFSPTGQRFASGDDRGLIRIWQKTEDKAEWVPEHKLVGHNGSITSIRFLPEGERLVTASSDRTCAEWDLTKGEELLALVLRHPDRVSSLDISADGTYAVTTCDDGMARVWRLADAQVINSIASKDGTYNFAGLTPNGKAAVLTSSAKGKVLWWDLNTLNVKDAKSEELQKPPDNAAAETLLDFAAFDGMVRSTTVAPNGRHILTIGSNDAQLWNVDTRKPVVRYGPHGAVASADISPDGRFIATGSWDHSAKIWEASTGRAIRKFDGGHNGYVNSVAFSRDGGELLTASDDATARLWDVESGKPLDVVFRGHTGRVTAATYSRDGARVLTTSGDQSGRVWERASAKLLQELKGHTRAVLCGQFSPDDQRVITGSEDNTAIIWDLSSGEQAITLAGHTAAITAVAFSPDGTRAVTGSRDNTAKLWDPRTGKEILSLTGHTQEVTTVSFSPDGRYVLTASRDGTAIIWLAADWRDDEPLRTAGEAARRHAQQASNVGGDEVSTRAPAQAEAAQPTQTNVTDFTTIDHGPYLLESLIQAHEYATQLHGAIAQMDNDNDVLIAAYEKLSDLCTRQMEQVQPMYEAGRAGYEADYEALVRTRFHRVNAELAALRGEQDVQARAVNGAILAAGDWLTASQAAYESNKITLDALLKAIDGITSLEIQRAEFDGNAEGKRAALQAKISRLTGLWRTVYALNQAGRRGGEAEKEALVRAKLLDAATQAAEIHKASEEPVNTEQLGFPAGPLPAGIKPAGMTAIQLSELTRSAGADALAAAEAAYEANQAPLDLLLEANAFLGRLEAAHAQRLGDRSAVLHALALERDACLDIWRKIDALHAAGRQGGETYKYYHAAAHFAESHARLVARADELQMNDEDQNAFELTAGSTPPSFNGATARDAYRSAVQALNQLVDAITHAANAGSANSVALSSFGFAPTAFRYLSLEKIASDGTPMQAIPVQDEALDDLPAFFAMLPDGRYRINLVETDNNSQQLVVETYLRNGRMIDPADDSEGARDRPPTVEEAPTIQIDSDHIQPTR